MTNRTPGLSPRETIYYYAGDVAASHYLKREADLPQHGSVSCYEHSLAVTEMSIRLAAKVRADVDMESMIKGALLHDYYLYDWRDDDTTRRAHGFGHARRALANARRDFDLSDIAEEVIAKHMFPLNIAPPRCKEAVIVSVADKICATREVCAFLRHKVRQSNVKQRFRYLTQSH